MLFGEHVVVVGHRRPDLDSIAAAIGYAELLTRTGRKAVAARTGALDAQSEWALERFGFAPPEQQMDAAPTFGAIAKRVGPFTADLTLAEAIERIALGARALPVVDADNKPLALVDARACVVLLGRAGARVGHPGSLDAIQQGASRAGEPIVRPDDGLDQDTPLLMKEDERVEDRRRMVSKLDPDDFIVVDAGGRYVGVASRSDILAPPRARLVLVDHNELPQAIPGAEQAEIVEVLDHHRLGNPSTLVPIPFAVDIVGSTSTLVAERWRGRGLELPASLAGLLLGAILSDTLAFRSPTTTARDREIARALADRAGITELDAFGLDLVRAGAGLGQRSGKEIVEEDYKEYDTAAGKLVVAQAEVRALHEIGPRAADLQRATEELRTSRGANLALLLLTDPVRAQSRLIACGLDKLVSMVPYPQAADGLFDATDVVSRKTQLVPALLAALAP